MIQTYCKECPLRMFNDKCFNLEGVGNALFGKLIVVPNVDYNAYRNRGMSFSKYVEIIKEVLNSSTGGCYEDYFIVPLIRCNLTEKCPVNKDIIRRCINYTIKDIIDNNSVKILLLGDAAKYYLNIDSIEAHINKLYVIRDSFTIRGYSVNYSPFVKYIDDDKYKEFCNHLIKWYNADKDNNYNGYEVKIL